MYLIYKFIKVIIYYLFKNIYVKKKKKNENMIENSRAPVKRNIL